MAVGFEEFLLNVPGSKIITHDMAANIASSGDFERLEGTAVIINRIINQLLITKGTYFFDPLFGENIHRYLFEPVDNITLQEVSNLVSRVIEQNRQNANIAHEVLFYRDRKGFRINLIIKTDGNICKFPLDIDESLLKDVE